MPESSLHIFGIRHHGPGSARSLRQALEGLKPDVVLVEGPPEAAPVLPLVLHADMQPPVALLIYQPEPPHQAAYYPFAVFSPEWQALYYGLRQVLPVRFMDLPIGHRFALTAPGVGQPAVSPVEPLASAEPSEPGATPEVPLVNLRPDPLGWLAQAAGYSDGERWWEHMVEQRQDSTDLFAAILEAMTALRETTPPETPTPTDPDQALEPLREAHMRQTIRAAQQEGFKRIAVVCGAWHAPVLTTTALTLMPASQDAALLKNLPKIAVAATWIPWTNGRLAAASGYGAGITSPGWYGHLWEQPNQTVIRWFIRIARLLREEGLDVSSAHLIEAVRLTESLASLRERPLPGLPELDEATQAVLCGGETLPMELIHQKLVIGETLGTVPGTTPMVPLQQDLLREQKRLRLSPTALEKLLDLDLRKPNDLERSYLLHRLNLLGVSWGRAEKAGGKSGTFHEFWRLRWQPEYALMLIEAGLWGNTIEAAATGYVRQATDQADNLPGLTGLLEQVLLANLPQAVSHLMLTLQNEAARASDISHLMGALPPLANVLRYGNVRQTDVGMIGGVVDGLVVRICIGLPGACASLNDEAAGAMLKLLVAVHEALTLLQNPPQLEMWQAVLVGLAEQAGLHGLLAGRICRLLLEGGRLETAEVARRMGLALSRASEPAQAAAWVEGFLQGSGVLLVHDDRLWNLLDGWITQLPGELFVTLLPLLRRTFSTFTVAERRQMGERAKAGSARSSRLTPDLVAADFDAARAAYALPLLFQLLGIEVKV